MDVKVAARISGWVGLGALLALSAPPWPDDWDGLGFVASVTRFDLDRFAPHPPGYPVYVALLKIAGLVLPAVAAASSVSVASGIATAWLAGDAARRAWGERACWPARLAVVVTPSAWHAMTGVGTEGLALALAMLGAWALVVARERARVAALALGLAVGLGLGVRLSWAPLYLPMLLLVPRPVRARAVLVAVSALVAWAAPLAAIVGSEHLVHLYRVHGAGHFSTWGGTAASEPGAGRALYLLRDVFVDGLGAGSDRLGIAIVAALIVLAADGVAAWRRAGWLGAGVAAVALAPYLIWIGLGQNLRYQPRHALPVVVALALGLALASTTRRRSAAVGAALAALVAARSARDAYARRAIPPAGAQLVALVRAQPAVPDVAVLGVTSIRFFEPTELAGQAFTVGTLGDGMVALTRARSLPRRVLVTDEVRGLDATPYPLRAVATLCRPPRIDRRAPCLAVYDWEWPLLRR